MTNREQEPHSHPVFSRVPINEEFFDENFVMLQVNPEALSGFVTETFTDYMVSIILARTIEGMKAHGAHALGLDEEPVDGQTETDAGIFAAMDVGVRILDDFAPRTDGTTWNKWLRAEFPKALAVMYGEDNGAVQLARQKLEE